MQHRLARARHLILFSDFDGTLAPIVRHPWQTRLPAATKAALAELARSPRVTLGVVSGRELTELRRLVGVKNISYVGSHGLEWALPNGRPHLRTTPVDRRRIRKVAGELRRTLRRLAGIWVESKTASVAVHYRNASRRDARRAVAQALRWVRRHAPRLKLLRGKKVVEFLPAGVSNKGGTVRRLLLRLRHRPRDLAIYLGDDVTDESVFARLRKNDLGILVGRPRATYARLYLRSPEEVCNFLQRLGIIVL